jgi:outer membrane protein TolC
MIPSRILIGVLFLAPLTVGSAQRADTVRLSVVDALARVLRESDEIRIGQAQLEVTGAQVTQARASGLPALNLRGTYTQQVRNARATIVSTGIFGQSYTYTTTALHAAHLPGGASLFCHWRRGRARCVATHALRPGPA